MTITPAFVPSAPFVVSGGSAALSALSKLLTGAAAGSYLWSAFSGRDRTSARARIESSLGLLPAEVPELTSGGRNIFYEVTWVVTFIRDGEVQEGSPSQSGPFTLRGPIGAPIFTTPDGGSRWRLPYEGGTEEFPMASDTALIEDGNIVTVTDLQVVPLNPDDEDTFDPENFQPSLPPPFWNQEETRLTDDGFVEVDGETPEGQNITFNFGNPVFTGSELRIPTIIPAGVPTGNGRPTPGPVGVDISFDFSPGGSPTPSIARGGSTTTRTSGDPSPQPQPQPEPIIVRPGTATPTWSPPEIPGVEIDFDFSPPEIQIDLEPPELFNPERFPDWIPEIEIDFEPDLSTPQTRPGTCPSPCAEIPEFPEFPDLATPESMVVAADISSTVPSGLAGLTAVTRGETEFYLPRLGTCLWVDSNGNRSHPVDLKVLQHRLTPPDFSGDWVDVDVLPSRGIEIEVNLVQGEKFPDIRFEE